MYILLYNIVFNYYIPYTYAKTIIKNKKLKFNRKALGK